MMTEGNGNDKSDIDNSDKHFSITDEEYKHLEERNHIIGEANKKYIGNPPKEDKRKRKIKHDDINNHEGSSTIKSKRIQFAYKYSNRGKGPLHGAILLAGRPIFITYNNGNIEQVETIEESNRIIKPPEAEEYPLRAL